MKITNPAKGQQMAIGKNLTISGTSNYNATSNCGFFVIVDAVREGINRITSKLLCQVYMLT